ncbi:hypothetical protein BE61_80930 [Bradyrhizobium elkanii USDA 61]|nr:hypothetical protein BE61_80930 [Bradyrhizobium elkanii USDA 61]GEC56337.1 hypothetical protein BEL01nite_53800 [Bradyrhizobium elkanii]
MMRKVAFAAVPMCRTIAIAMRCICMATRACSIHTMPAMAMITLIILAIIRRMMGRRL